MRLQKKKGKEEPEGENPCPFFWAHYIQHPYFALAL
jgi:hypothetical protein